MELTEEALQQSAASPGQDGTELESRAGTHDAKDSAGTGSELHHGSAGHTPNAPPNNDAEMSDRNKVISQVGGTPLETTPGGNIPYEDGEEDAEGEVDEDYEFMDAQLPPPTEYPTHAEGAPPEAGEEHTDEDDEGVGAVKMRPGESDEEDHESEASAATPSDAESEGDAEWEEDDEVAENDDADEESDNAQSNNCLFCKENEENDPSEEFEAYLTCAGCGDNCK